MKKSKESIFEYEQERNRDLMKAYKKQISLHFHSGEPIRLHNVFKCVAEMPSERFWVSEERAYVVILGMLKGKKLEKMGGMKREMFQEIYRRVMELKRLHPEQCLKLLVEKVCSQPAPKFYLTPKTIKVIIYKIKRNWYETRKQKS